MAISLLVDRDVPTHRMIHGSISLFRIIGPLGTAIILWLTRRSSKGLYNFSIEICVLFSFSTVYCIQEDSAAWEIFPGAMAVICFLF